MASTTCGQDSHQAPDTPQRRFHQAGVEETANCILEERCENSPRKRVYENRLLILSPLLKYRPLSPEALRFTRATPWWENPPKKIWPKIHSEARHVDRKPNPDRLNAVYRKR